MPMKMHSATFFVTGMTCGSCEHLVRDAISGIAGVENVKVSLSKGTVTLTADEHGTLPTLHTLNAALKGTHYSLSTKPKDRSDDMMSGWPIFAVALIVAIAFYQIIKSTGITSISAPAEGTIGLATVFLIGLAASVSSCLAMVGGLLLSVSAAWSETHQQDATMTRAKPLILFNVGRLIGYLVLGGVVGLVGHSLALSLRTTGIVTIVLSLIMIMLGLNILNIIPKKYCTIPLPRAVWKRINDLSSSANPSAALALGALTFFVPCGYTLSMQLLALSSGSFVTGALIMGTFALGTLPALLGISMVSSLAHGKFGRVFFQFSGALVILLGIMNVGSGLTLAGVNVDSLFAFNHPVQASGSDPHVRIDKNGQQIISLTVSDNGYSPLSVTIDGGKPTWVYAFAAHPISGCAAFLTSPSDGLQTAIKPGGNWLGPIKQPTKDFVLACSMGMYRTNVHVRGT